MPVATTDLIGFTQAGTGAVERSAQSKLRESVSIADFGAVGDETGDGAGTDDTTNIQAAADSGVASLTFVAGLTYRITDTVTFPAGMDVDFRGARILYTGTRDRPAVIIGEVGVGNSARIENAYIQALTEEWDSESFVALRMINASRAFLSWKMLRGFTFGLECYSQGHGYAHTNHHFESVFSCQRGIVLTTKNVEGSYCNENNFWGGDITNGSNTDEWGDSSGVFFKIDTGADPGSNKNVFWGTCFQPGDGDPGDVRIPILFDDCGISNRFVNIRHEGGRGPTMLCLGENTGPRDNEATVLVYAGMNIIEGVVQEDLARSNRVVSVQNPGSVGASFTISNMPNKILGYSTSHATALAPLHLTDGTSVPAISIGATGGSIKPRRYSVELAASRTVGFFVDVEEGDEFLLYSHCESGKPGLVGVNALDADMTILTSSADGYPHILSYNYRTDTPNVYKADYGGSYYVGSTTNVMRFSVREGVAFIRVFAAGVCYLKALSLVRTNQREKPLNVFSGLNNQDGVHLAGSDFQSAIVGVYSRGHLALNDAASSGGSTPMGWIATSAGRLAPAWVASTAYLVGDLVLNDSGSNVYECKTAGTSAGSGGPTGTGSGISDGTCVWDYLSLRPNVAPGPAIP